jgi:hypothetical protein
VFCVYGIGASLMRGVIRQHQRRHDFSRRTCVAIDIDNLTEAELIDLNNRIVERLRFLSQMHAHAEMLEFKIGDRVVFQPAGRAEVVGMLTRYNRKTVTVITDDGQRWNVSPALIRRATKDAKSAPGQNVIELRKK